MAWVYFYAHKGQFYKKVAEFKTMVETQTSRKVKRVRSDQALEFHSKQVTEFAKKYGIILETSAIYAHEQNGKAERMNKPLTDMARMTMIESCLPEALWAEALRTACHVRNRIVSGLPRSDKPTTPFKAYYGQKPEVQHMRPFGCSHMSQGRPNFAGSPLSNRRFIKL